jgi:hypothetical protein
MEYHHMVFRLFIIKKCSILYLSILACLQFLLVTAYKPKVVGSSPAPAELDYWRRPLAQHRGTFISF